MIKIQRLAADPKGSCRGLPRRRLASRDPIRGDVQAWRVLAVTVPESGHDHGGAIGDCKIHATGLPTVTDGSEVAGTRARPVKSREVTRRGEQRDGTSHRPRERLRSTSTRRTNCSQNGRKYGSTQLAVSRAENMRGYIGGKTLENFDR